MSGKRTQRRSGKRRGEPPDFHKWADWVATAAKLIATLLGLMS